MPAVSTRRPAIDVAEARACFAGREAERREARETLRRQRLAEARDAIRRLAPQYPGVSTVYLYGSILKPGRFTRRSDVDVAVVCADVETESRFWGRLDEALGGIVDLRPLAGGVAAAVERYGERVYERETPGPRP